MIEEKWLYVYILSSIAYMEHPFFLIILYYIKMVEKSKQKTDTRDLKY
jgi:hypothetical protein